MVARSAPGCRGTLKYCAPVTLTNCRSVKGGIETYNPVGAPLRINNCLFHRTDALTSGGLGIEQNEVEVTQTLFGNPLDSVAGYWGRKRISAAGTRTYDIEGTSLSDDSVLYSSLSITISGSISKGFTVDINGAGQPAIFHLTLHGLRPGLPIAFKTNGALPTGLSADKTYYVLSDGASPQPNTFRVSRIKGGAPVETTGSQSGTHTLRIVREYAVGDHVLKNNVGAGGSPGWICTTAGPSLANVGGSVAMFKALAPVAS